MKVVVMARVSEDISRAEEALKADPRFRELEEYESTLDINLNSGQVFKHQNPFPVFGGAEGSSLKIFTREPGECCITIDGMPWDIESILDFLKIPKDAFSELLRG
ncbi:hypothetical protein A3G55_04380 [Candidatus Giovannonibacteria bacterium RIFCSPLOWO2_12_FULL_44_25]|uniref:Uncharacterized protein n=3 Tax=Parcubacteria group TaxID=1794811 RepID=A0A837IK67_9BACT|nr:MAG: hypothetical protein UW15_C0002G0041 [Parcubacteria group bacterium GW2011_GWC1_44_10]KKT59956.1 MAG: hypothetical protein UW53_C0005G0039 [Candidatus Giovannonibacteria bacterium GW2011_GWA1_44_25]KKU12436.1 MAG: hypothetical protein UX18_C0024G0005 [Candidatus Azambacteria bacterium GW2011_GWC2_45_7b]KKU29729.1 MAG: hypothetical protein UX43_C0006G0004 [Candidatus Giovannonibacteria bacterium GW2011_GWB1_46_20]OGF49163.1 MAG: hypothetical protein A2120_01760 [Candidatus Giovannonibact